MDMGQFVIPRSDQLNSDDLLAGPRTITITKVIGTGSIDQPVAVYFDGDEGKPYKPCKSMRRVMIAGWGIDASAYPGRSMTIYCDPKVVFGGLQVGGIRISHMSHLAAPLNLALTITKAKRAPYRVSPLAITKGAGGEGASGSSCGSAAKDHPLADPFGIPPLTDDGTDLDLDAIRKTYEGYRDRKDRKGLTDWLGAMAPAAQDCVRDLMAADKAGAA